MNIKTEKHPPYAHKGQWVTTWSAWDDDTYDGAPDSHCYVGSGKTELEAVIDLVETTVVELETNFDAARAEIQRLRKDNNDLVETVNRLVRDAIRATGTRVLDEEETE